MPETLSKDYIDGVVVALSDFDAELVVGTIPLHTKCNAGESRHALHNFEDRLCGYSHSVL